MLAAYLTSARNLIRSQQAVKLKMNAVMRRNQFDLRLRYFERGEKQTSKIPV